MKKLVSKYLFLFVVGGLLYVLIEHLWRGFSHWTMFALGGACFVILGLINEIIPWQMPLWQQMLIGAAGITVLEFYPVVLSISGLTGMSGTTQACQVTFWGRFARNIRFYGYLSVWPESS